MPEQATITLPGTKKKIPRWMLWVGAAGGGVLLFLLTRNSGGGGGGGDSGGGDSGASGESSSGSPGVSSDDLDARFQQYQEIMKQGIEGLSNRLDDLEKQRIGGDGYLGPPGTGGGSGGDGGLGATYADETFSPAYAPESLDMAPADTPVITDVLPKEVHERAHAPRDAVPVEKVYQDVRGKKGSPPPSDTKSHETQRSRDGGVGAPVSHVNTPVISPNQHEKVEGKPKSKPAEKASKTVSHPTPAPVNKNRPTPVPVVRATKGTSKARRI